jgi:hypothetical protein
MKNNTERSRIVKKSLLNQSKSAYITHCAERRTSLKGQLEVAIRLKYSGPRLHPLVDALLEAPSLKEKSDAQGPDPGSNLTLFCGSLQ